MAIPPTHLPPEVKEALEVLAENLLHAEPIVAFRHAQARLDANAQARSLIERLSAAQADLRTRQARNAVTKADVDKLRALQREAQTNRIIMEYAEAQQAAIPYLPEVNQEISALLGVDFAALAGPGSC
jgi:cell fate (sporulation/competence/biofilm development) regulator YlbF (YheA/YmcA/DUF963 family)